jgi:phage shock protein A
MENQFMQVKTQVAIAIADQHLLQKRQKESLEAQQEWVRKAELALAKADEKLARVALERSMTHETAAQNFSEQIEDQSHQVEMLKTALHQLEQKMAETRAKAELLIARHRRAKLSARAGATAMSQMGQESALRRIGDKVTVDEAAGIAEFASPDDDSPEKRLQDLERADKVDKLLSDLKRKAGHPAA